MSTKKKNTSNMYYKTSIYLNVIFFKQTSYFIRLNKYSIISFFETKCMRLLRFFNCRVICLCIVVYFKLKF